MIEQNFRQIQEKIKQSKQNANRTDEVNLVGVTKYVDTNCARQSVEAGVKHIAENRTELFLEKYQALSDLEITWHLIGTLQRRKVKDVINLVDYFHALDSLRLAKEIQKRAERIISVFIQVNISGEESKHGISADELVDFVISLKECDKIKVVGLMTMAPLHASEAELHVYFSKLRECRDIVSNLKLSYAPCTELSMGMSQDFEIAIEEGATFVRIGSQLFK